MATVWKGTLSFGLVNVPVKVSTAARSENISFNQIHGACGGRINQKTFCPTCDKDVERAELLKGYEVEKGKYITIDPEEIKALAPESSQVLTITQAVKGEEVDPMLLESSYYLEPDKGGVGGYSLLLAALEDEEKVALGQVTLSSREHTVVIRPYNGMLVMHTLYLQDEVNDAPKFDTVPVNATHLALAKQLLMGITSPFEHDAFIDHYRANVQKMIEAKIEGQANPVVTKKAATKSQPDIMAALINSIEAAGHKASISKSPAKAEIPKKKKSA